MRVLMTVHGYKPATELGGPVSVVSGAAEGLARRGHEVTVVTTNAGLAADTDVPFDTKVDVAGVAVWYFERREPLRRLPLPYLARSAGVMYAPRMRARLRQLVPSADVVNT